MNKFDLFVRLVELLSILSISAVLADSLQNDLPLEVFPEILENETNNDILEDYEEIQSNRDPRFLFFIKIRATECDTGMTGTPTGTCLDYKTCRRSSGTKTTSCAKGFGTCCLFRTTGGTTSRNNTNFVSPGFPSTTTNGGTFSLTVNRQNTNICQVRIDFVDFNIAQPNSEGVCASDLMTVTGGTTPVPTICGSNTGQHIYVNVDSTPLKIMFDLDTADTTTARSYNLKVSQIPCGSRTLAPMGCLQYFTTSSGTVQSFNFPASPSATLDATETRQLSNTDYTICVRPESGRCSISWIPNQTFDPFNFFVSGDGPSLATAIFGQIEAASYGSIQCPIDYVMIPGGSFTNATSLTETADRFCGPAFPNPVLCTSMPFNMRVVTDAVESPIDSGNFGFTINFRQNVCTR